MDAGSLTIEAKIMASHLVIELREDDDQGGFLVSSTEVPLADLAAALVQIKTS